MLTTNKKIKSTFFILFFFAIAINGQNGYKEFKWSENLSSVQSKKNIVEDYNKMLLFRGFQVAYFIQNGNLSSDSKLADPEDKIDGKLKYYTTDDKETTFIFCNDKLVAVMVEFNQQRNKIVNDLVSKYGSCSSKFMTYGSLTIELKSWFPNSDRIITYEYDKSWDVETVTYLDKNFYNKAASKLKAEQMGQQKKLEKKRESKID